MGDREVRAKIGNARKNLRNKRNETKLDQVETSALEKNAKICKDKIDI